VTPANFEHPYLSFLSRQGRGGEERRACGVREVGGAKAIFRRFLKLNDPEGLERATKA